MAPLPVALRPEPEPAFLREAVEAGGGRVVDPEQAEVLLWNDASDAAGLKRLLGGPTRAVRWVQLPWAGVEAFHAEDMFTDGRLWTAGKGVYAEPVAEHALALGLAGLRRLPERVQARSWGSQAGTSLYDGRVLVLGGGGITEALLPLLAPFRAQVTVLRRSGAPMAGAARTVGPERLHDELPGADLVVLALALTPETTGVIGAAELDAMDEHAWLVNVGRGRHVVTDDLVEALQTGSIGGAALDVTDPEPLPEGHPLWGLPNCIITPHTANTLAMAKPLLARRVTENVRRYVAGEPLIGVVDPELGY